MKTAVHQYEDKLLEFAYGELPDRDAEAVEAHVQGCARCSEALTQIRSVRSTMSVLPMEAAPEAGLESLLAYAGQHAARAKEAAPRAWWKRYLLPLAPVAAMLVVGVVAFRANREYQPNALNEAVAAQREERKAAQVAQAPAAAAVPAPEPRPATADLEAKPMEQGVAEPEKQVADYSNAAQRGALRGKGEAYQQANSLAGDVKGGAGGVKPAALAKEDAAFAGEAGTADSTSGTLDDSYAQRPSVAKRQAPPSKAALSKKASRDLPAAPQPSKVAANDLGYGLGTPGTVGKDQADKAAKQPDVAEKKVAEQKEAEARAPVVQAQEPSPVQQPVATVSPAPPPTKPSYAPPKSLSVGLSSGSAAAGPSGSGRSRANDEVAAAVEENVDRKVENDRAETKRRSNTQELDAKLAEARKASTSGNHKLEVSLCLEVVNGGAEGSQRAEALKRLCDVLEAMGAQAQADPYCDALVRDFSATAAARDVAQRRSMVQRVQAAPAADSAAEKASTKAKAKKASKAAPSKASSMEPAQAY